MAVVKSIAYERSIKWLNSFEVPSVTSHSKISTHGVEYIRVCVKKPIIDKNGLESGGVYIAVIVDHIKQQTEVWEYKTMDGTPIYPEKASLTLKDSIYDESDSLKIAEQFLKIKHS